ncbi:MAG TPA: hypothetical protein VH575_11395 [Gemmataceae bacterium]|jgi:hypothetical protein
MLKRWLVVFGCLGFILLSGCWEKDKTSPATSAKGSTTVVAAKAEQDCCSDSEEVTPFYLRLRDIASTYTAFGRVDDQMRWAPVLCAAPPQTPALRVSASKDSETHGHKLYSIFAKISERGCYFTEGQTNPVGQVIVKESWLPEEVAEKGPSLDVVFPKVEVDMKDAKDSTKTTEGEYVFAPPVRVENSFVPYARKDGRLYHASKKGPLFIMYKVAAKTTDTDEGWVYGTVTADGKEVTSAGRVESCMNCHQKAPHDRLFGLPENGSSTEKVSGR